ncbi:transporter substrate-binding domain-containing protein [Mycolicibacterium palauense]|uniref:transporter substrate-binding domain-containing protein n=1 Tax=Mycolicibacterium palauense TaxID=2034511 RepID=UPI000BFEFF35|nr:transporter substrate-binding domain-containing protein [Mycolicibacterium palauense]
MTAGAAALAPTGTLRVALNVSNTLLVERDGDGGWAGIAPGVARLLAAELGIACEFAPYPLPTDIAADTRWDVALIAVDPGRAADFAFGPPYARIDATLLVRAGHTAQSWRDLDVPGRTIAAPRGSAFGLWLQRHVEHAELRLEPGAGAFRAFVDEELDAFAGLRPALGSALRRVPGSRLLDDSFTAVQQGIAVRTPPAPGALELLDRFVDSALASGAIARLVEQYPAEGLAAMSHSAATNGASPPT